eukprot:1156876-Pelagomonas_calceolata.AAC.19
MLGAIEDFSTSFVGSTWPEPARPLPALKLCELAKQNLLPGLSSLAIWIAAGKVWEQRFQKFGLSCTSLTTLGPQNSSRQHKHDQHTFLDVLAGPGARE